MIFPKKKSSHPARSCAINVRNEFFKYHALCLGAVFFSSDVQDSTAQLNSHKSIGSRPASAFNYPLKYIYKVGLFEKEKVFLEKVATEG